MPLYKHTCNQVYTAYIVSMIKNETTQATNNNDLTVQAPARHLHDSIAVCKQKIPFGEGHPFEVMLQIL